MQLPKKGFYRHFKHDPKKGIIDYTYEVLGVARHTETDTYLVVYRPLYENIYLSSADFCVRPLDMFMENVEKDGKTLPRFELITDEKLVAALTKIRDEKYRTEM